MIDASSTADVGGLAARRWGQLVLGIVCMVAMANVQYGWTLFINPIDQNYHWGRAAIAVAFTVFIVAETCMQPVGGYLLHDELVIGKVVIEGFDHKVAVGVRAGEVGLPLRRPPAVLGRPAEQFPRTVALALVPQRFAVQEQRTARPRGLGSAPAQNSRPANAD